MVPSANDGERRVAALPPRLLDEDEMESAAGRKRRHPSSLHQNVRKVQQLTKMAEAQHAEGAKLVCDDSIGPGDESTALDSQKLTPTKATEVAADLTTVTQIPRKRSIAADKISDVPSSRESEDAAASSPVVAKKEPRNRRFRRDGLQLDNPFGELVSEIPPTNARYATRRRTAEAAAISTGGLSTPPEASSAPAIPVAARKSLPAKTQKGKTASKAETQQKTEKPAEVETVKPPTPEKPPKRRRIRGPTLPLVEPMAQEKETATAEPDNGHIESAATKGAPVTHATCEPKEHAAAAIGTSDSTAIVPTEDPKKANETPETESPNAAEKSSPALKASNGPGTGSENTEKSPVGKENTPEPTRAESKISPPLKATAAAVPVKLTGGPGTTNQQLVARLDSTPPRASSTAAPRAPRTFPGRITRNRVHEGESILALAFARTAQKPYSITKMACCIPDIVTDIAELPALEVRCKSRFEVPDWVFAPRGRVCPTGKKAVMPASGVIDPEFSTLRTNAPTLQDGGEEYSDLGHPTPPSESCDLPAASIPMELEASDDAIPSASSIDHVIAKRPIDEAQSSAPDPPAKRLRWRWLDPPFAPQHSDLHRFTHPLDETHTSHSHHLPIEHTLLPAPAWLPRELDDLAAGLAAVGKSFTRIAWDFVRTRPTADCVEAYYMRKHEIRRAAGWLRVRRKGPVAMAVSRAAVAAAAAAAAGGVAEGKDGGTGVRTKLLKTVQTGGSDNAAMAHDVGAGVKVEEATRVEAVRGTGAGRGRRGRGGKGIVMNSVINCNWRREKVRSTPPSHQLPLDKVSPRCIPLEDRKAAACPQWRQELYLGLTSAMRRSDGDSSGSRPGTIRADAAIPSRSVRQTEEHLSSPLRTGRFRVCVLEGAQLEVAQCRWLAVEGLWTTRSRKRECENQRFNAPHPWKRDKSGKHQTLTQTHKSENTRAAPTQALPERQGERPQEISAQARMVQRSRGGAAEQSASGSGSDVA
ncbi:hypothetical protein DFJ73DRAFT_921939 [Zopfochytrium polystomum]|nr:hypothetical protein DFJ73DRAFT_921939 [Zopfochytrium polystomum]